MAFDRTSRDGQSRISKPPPSATRPRLRRAKSLENIAFIVNDGTARRAKNAGVAVSGGTKEGTLAAVLHERRSTPVRAGAPGPQPKTQTFAVADRRAALGAIRAAGGTFTAVDTT